MSKCTDCNEYNQDKHCCPKFCDVIRETTKEMQEYYKSKHEKLERIEQIINEVQLYEDCYRAINKIKEVLEQE